MNKLTTLLALTALTAACNRQPNPDDLVTMAVGTYTTHGSTGIYTFRFNQATGEAQPLDTLPMTNPSYVTFSPDGRRLYAVSETNDNAAHVETYHFDSQTGAAVHINSQPTYGEDPCYVSTDGHILAVANYTGGSLSLYRLNTLQAPEPLDTLFCGNLGGPDPDRQQTPHIHCAHFTPDGNYLIATDFSADQLLTIPFSAANHTTYGTPRTTRLPSDTGPRHLIFSPDAAHAYVVGELSEAVTVLTYEDGTLNPIQTLDIHEHGDRHGADLALTPDGQYLYASTRNVDDGVAIFRRNAADGTLTRTGYRPTAKHPRNIALTPNGRFLLVSCMDSDRIQVFRVGRRSGELLDAHRDIHLSRPVCVAFAPTP